MANLQERGRMAAIRYLELTGHEIIDEDFEGFIVADDGDSLVFADVRTKRDNMPRIPKSMASKFEKAAVAYLAEHDVVDRSVRCDFIALHVASEDRAMVKHHKNCLN